MAKGKNKHKKKQRAARSERLVQSASLPAIPTPTFPVPGEQDCFPVSPFKAHGPQPTAPGVVTRVRLFIENQAAIEGDLTTSDATTWRAVFGGVTTFDPRTPLRLVIEGTDGTTSSTLGISFSHVPPAPPSPAPSLTFDAVPAGNHSLAVEGDAADTDSLTVLVDGVSASPGFNSSTGHFSFTAGPASSSQIVLEFNAINSAEDVTIEYILPVDFVAPRIENVSMNEVGNIVTITGDAIDDESGFASAEGLAVVLTALISGQPVPTTDYDVDPGLSPDKKMFSFTITIDKNDMPAQEQIEVEITATDVAGNASSPHTESFSTS